ncbi:FAD-binding protein [Actinomyces timonensis]|uniref:FAD-binding protein n=1 Tax=Actinomyces timonensis TaxID=1288391 RepID=UPI00030866A8|nr:electron transfer flavoprotein subunit alpha/FixB family protein [Actinomyces timonensis]
MTIAVAYKWAANPQDAAVVKAPGMKDILAAGKKKVDVVSPEAPTATLEVVSLSRPEPRSRKNSILPNAEELIDAGPGDLILAADRAAERVIAGAVAARLDAPVLTGVTSISDGAVTRARYGGLTLETVRSSRPIVIIAPGGSPVAGEPVAPEAASTEESPYPASITAQSGAEAAQADLSTAKTIVAGGRGFKAKEELGLLEDVAAALGAETACSRPLAETVDWMPKSRCIGVSGQKVHPDLYIAVGISGQMQHMAGARDSKTIVVINSDAEAPIFAQADYGVVGDLTTVLPALGKALQ